MSCKKEKSCEGCRETNKPPIALAGPDQVLTLPTDSVSLDGSASNDPDGTVSEWLWKKISGPASFIFINAVTAKTIVKDLDTGIYRFELMIKDSGGLSAKDTIQVTVNDQSQPNRPPVANAGVNQRITLPTNTVTLDGSASTDPDNNIAGYLWTKISGPPSFDIANATATQTLISNLEQGVYQFELKVTDGGGLIDKDTMQVTVNPQVNNAAVDIYVAGADNGGPVYWKNGQVTALDYVQSGFTATSIAVVGSDICVAGTKFELFWNDYAAKYWKNGVQQPLGNYASANSIALSGNDVYVAGWEWESTGSGIIPVAKYWKNGQPVLLPTGAMEAYANSIAIAGSDVYVAGEAGHGAIYWKNGQAVSLASNLTHSGANSIAVVGADVYVAGYEGDIAKYWKNGQAVSLSGGIATSIAVVGSDVYLAGYYYQAQGISIAKYWKNGQEVLLTSGSEAFARAIAVFGNDVYVAGHEDDGNGIEPKYWKNGHAISLPSTGGLATSIVVVNR